MHMPTEADFLTVWERGRYRHPIDQALLLGAWARPDIAPERMADLPLGTLNVALLRLRETCFGTRLEAYVDCERCAQRLEFAVDTSQLVAPPPVNQQQTFELAGFRFRALCWRDLARVAGETAPEQAAHRLLECCCVERPDNAQGDLGERADDVEAGLLALDPASEFRFSLACDACGHQWLETLDIHGLLWEEVEAHARAVLIDVHYLASAYGWSEAEILALSPERRATYVQMVNP